MGIFDQIKDAVGDNAEAISNMAEQAVDQVADKVDNATGKKFSEQIDGAAKTAKDAISDAISKQSE